MALKSKDKSAQEQVMVGEQQKAHQPQLTIEATQNAIPKINVYAQKILDPVSSERWGDHGKQLIEMARKGNLNEFRKIIRKEFPPLVKLGYEKTFYNEIRGIINTEQMKLFGNSYFNGDVKGVEKYSKGLTDTQQTQVINSTAKRLKKEKGMSTEEAWKFITDIGSKAGISASVILSAAELFSQDTNDDAAVQAVNNMLMDSMTEPRKGHLSIPLAPSPV